MPHGSILRHGNVETKAGFSIPYSLFFLPRPLHINSLNTRTILLGVISMSNNSALQQESELVAVPLPSPKSLTLTRAAAPKAASPKAAIRRCCTAWQRAFDGYSGHNEYTASKEASAAYCRAMPVLADGNCIRDFIACAAHGMVIGAIPESRGRQLLYAAQVALTALKSEPEPPKSTR